MAHIEPVGKPKGRISALKSFRYAPSISTPGDSTPCAVLCMLQHMYPNLKMDMMRFINFFINWFLSLFHTLSITTLQSANAFSMPRGRS